MAWFRMLLYLQKSKTRLHEVNQMKNPDVVIIGAGGAGCATGYYLANANKKVLILEKEAIASHASGFAFGGLQPLAGAGIPGPALPLAIASHELHKSLASTLAEETGMDTHFRIHPRMHLAFDEETKDSLLAALQWQKKYADFNLNWLSAGEVEAYESRLSKDIIGAMLIEGTASIESYRYVLALAQAIEKKGGEIKQGTAIGIRKTGPKALAVRLENSEIPCEHVVIASGPWTYESSEWINWPIPVKPLKGQILRLSIPSGPLNCSFNSGHGYVGTKPDGLTWLGTTEESVGFDDKPTSEARDYLISFLLKMLPELDDAQIIHHTACLRPMSKDGLPIIGQVPGLDNVFVAAGAGRKGILLSTGMGKAICELILDKKSSLATPELSLERFDS